MIDNFIYNQMSNQPETALKSTLDIAINVGSIISYSHLIRQQVFFMIKITADYAMHQNGRYQSHTISAIPYQIINDSSIQFSKKVDKQMLAYKFHQRKFPEKSNISHEGYISPILDLRGRSQINLNQICVYKLHLPARSLQYTRISVTCQLKERKPINSSQSFKSTNQAYSTEKQQMQIQTLSAFTLQYTDILSINNYLPLFFPKVKCSIEATIHTHLLSIWTQKPNNIYFQEQVIEQMNLLVNSFNRIKNRIEEIRIFPEETIKMEEKKQQNDSIIQELLLMIDKDSSQNLQPTQILTQVPIQTATSNFIERIHEQVHTNLLIFQTDQYKKIEQYISKRIFKPHSQIKHQLLLKSFFENHYCNLLGCLLTFWKDYLILLRKDFSRENIVSKFRHQPRDRYRDRDIRSESNFIEEKKNIFIDEYCEMLKKIVFLYEQGSQEYSMKRIEHQDRSKLQIGLQLSNLCQCRDPPQLPTPNKSAHGRRLYDSKKSKHSSKKNSINNDSYCQQVQTDRRKINLSKLLVMKPSIRLQFSKDSNISFDKVNNINSQFMECYQNSHHIGNDKIHLLVLVHGLGATAVAFSQLKTTLQYLHPKLHILNSKANQNSGDKHPNEMGRALAVQVINAIEQISTHRHRLKFIGEMHHEMHIVNLQNIEISFLGHSMGGLIIRAALPYLNKYKQLMKSYISLATPHLGHLFHNSYMTKFGMWFLQKIEPVSIIQILLMNDCQKNEQRNSYLYKLSESQGLNWFQSITLFGNEYDKFVSPISALIDTQNYIKQKSQNKQTKAIIYEQMRKNLIDLTKNIPINKIKVEFPEQLQTDWKSKAIGRATHVAFLNDQSFLNILGIGFKHLFQCY